jgi:hypothetical protein
MILFGMVAATPAFGACGASRLPVIDWGLRRQYLIERDCTHPERPATLLEITWSDALAGRARDEVRPNPSEAESLKKLPWLVHAGMHVTLVGQNSETDIHLIGTALEQGNAGDSVRVKAGFHGKTLRGVVRGPGLVELEPQKGRN